jgi:predicted DNA-binding transcriptional regulator AlpA
MPEVEPTQAEIPPQEQWPATSASQFALEVARVLRESGLAAPLQPPSPWISLEETARMFGYSVSRFYHVYEDLGLVPSRASQRKLRFNRQDVERTLRERQKTRRGRPRRHVMHEKIVGTK